MVLSHLLVKEVVVISTPNSTWKLLEIAQSVTGTQNPPVMGKIQASRAHVALLLFHKLCISVFFSTHIYIHLHDIYYG